MKNIKVLIIEDDSELATMYKLKFEKEWFKVKVADDWFTGVTLVTEFNPNIILLDIMMPSMDWFETLRIIRELAPSLTCKIIMFSNLNSKEDINKCMDLWADAYLLKAEITPKQAVDKIYELLNEPKKEINSASHENLISKCCPHCWKDITFSVEIK